MQNKISNIRVKYNHPAQCPKGIKSNVVYSAEILNDKCIVNGIEFNLKFAKVIFEVVGGQTWDDILKDDEIKAEFDVDTKDKEIEDTEEFEVEDIDEIKIEEE